MPSKTKTLTWKTAMSRTTLPAPTKWLQVNGLLQGNFLDFGCGKCHKLNKGELSEVCDSVDSYDPFYRPDGINHREYETIVCNYVLNVIPDKKERKNVLWDIVNLLSTFGKAFVTVRNDKRKLKGYTKIGTWQGKVRIPKEFPHAVINETSSYIMYVVSKPDSKK